MTRKTDREVSEALHTQVAAQVAAIRRLAPRAPMNYIKALLEGAATFLEDANTAWADEEKQAGAPLWR